MSIDKRIENGSSKLSKLILPVIASLFIPFVCYHTFIVINPLDPTRDGDGAMYISWLIDYIIFPVSCLTLLLLQWLIVLPLWEKWRVSYKNLLFSSIVKSLYLSVPTGVVSGVLFWQKQFGVFELFISISIIGGVVSIYCVGNIISLYYLDRAYTSTMLLNEKQL